nr:hypothetical protein [Tanacetum cinerariifolium]
MSCKALQYLVGGIISDGGDDDNGSGGGDGTGSSGSEGDMDLLRDGDGKCDDGDEDGDDAADDNLALLRGSAVIHRKRIGMMMSRMQARYFSGLSEPDYCCSQGCDLILLGCDDPLTMFCCRQIVEGWQSVRIAHLSNLHERGHISFSFSPQLSCRAYQIRSSLSLFIRIKQEMSKPVPQAIEAGKMTLFQPDIISLQDIRATHTRKRIEVRVYWKWIAKNVTTKEPTNFYCILLEKELSGRMAECENCSPQQPPRAQPHRQLI